jgi:hypothetical protein
MMKLVTAVGLILLVPLGCMQLARVSDSPNGSFNGSPITAFSNESLIKFQVYEYVITNQLKPSMITPIFVEASDAEYDAMKAKFANIDLKKADQSEVINGRKIRDKTSKIGGCLLRMWDTHIRGKKAQTVVSCNCGGEMTFVFDLKKNKTNWNIQEAGMSTLD